MYGLSKMDNRRHNAQRNAAIRKHNNAAHQVGLGTASPVAIFYYSPCCFHTQKALAAACTLHSYGVIPTQAARMSKPRVHQLATCRRAQLCGGAAAALVGASDPPPPPHASQAVSYMRFPLWLDAARSGAVLVASAAHATLHLHLTNHQLLKVCCSPALPVICTRSGAAAVRAARATRCPSLRWWRLWTRRSATGSCWLACPSCAWAWRRWERVRRG